MELKVVVLLNRRGKSEGGRGGQAARGGVGMEVFRGLPADWLRHGNAQSGLTKCGRPSLALQAWDRRRERGVCRSRKQRCRPSDYNLAWTQIKYLGWSKTLARHSRSQYWTLKDNIFCLYRYLRVWSAKMSRKNICISESCPNPVLFIPNPRFICSCPSISRSGINKDNNNKKKTFYPHSWSII